MEIQEIKKEIKRLKRLKLQCRAGTKERVDLHRQIKELKNKIVDTSKPEPEKELLIQEILKLKPSYITAQNIDYKKFSVKQLNFHLKKITQKGQDITIDQPEDIGKAGQVEGTKPEPEAISEPERQPEPEQAIKTRGRGRPKGSRNKK